MSALSFQVVDVFAEGRRRGLPVALVEGCGTLPAVERLQLAAELSLPLCVFVDRQADGVFLDSYAPRRPGGCPVTAALAAAARKGAGEYLTRDLRVQVTAAEGGRLAALIPELEFDAYRYRRELLCGMAGLDRYRLPDHWPLGLVRTGGWTLVVPVAAPDTLDGLRPDYDSLARLLEKVGAGRAVFYSWRGPVDLYLRSFAPASGVFEEPLTASAAAAAAALTVQEKALSLSPPRTRLTARGGDRLNRPAAAELLVEHDAEQVFRLTVLAPVVPSFSGVF